MTVDDVVSVARHAPDAHVVAVHLEAINHCLETRADLHQRLHEEDLTSQVTVPENGASFPRPCPGGGSSVPARGQRRWCCLSRFTSLAPTRGDPPQDARAARRA